MSWEILLTGQVEAFPDDLYESDRDSHRLVNQTILVSGAERSGRRAPAGRYGDRVADLQPEGIRPPSTGGSEVRILFVLDPWRSAILLVAGDKSGQWQRWYREAIPEAEQVYATYLKEREREKGVR